MSEPKQLSRAQQLVGDFAPKLAELTDEVLFGDVWARAELSPRDRSLVTVAALIANGNTEQLTGHLSRAKENGLTESELAEVIIHLAFYAGWPRAMSAVKVALRALSEGLRMEVKPYNIRTTVISPGAVATELLDSVTEADVAENLHKFYAAFAISADSFARTVAFAISQPEEVDINEILFRPTRQEL